MSPFLVGHILEATHQEGSYPTRYSTLYDLENRVVYLFHRHNFDEYVAIDLAAELARGARSYDIAPLFSRVRIQAPAHGATVAATSAELRWEGRLASDYRVCWSTSSDPAGRCEAVGVALAESVPASGEGAAPRHPIGLAGVGGLAGLLAGALLLGCLWRVVAPRSGRRRGQVLVFLAALLLAAGSCGGDGGPTGPGPDEVGTIRHALTGLEPGTTYYWQVRATAPGGAGFTSATFVRSFATADG